MTDLALLVNGKSRSVRAGSTVSDLLGALDLAPAQVVVEYNGEPLDRTAFAATRMSEGDRIEIAQMVGGG